ncbi:MAG: peptidase, partial [Bacteroidales bacterium]|nr:peptidase [Bacteroidales bacterium]
MGRAFLIIIVVLAHFIGQAQMSPQTKEITRKFFPDPDIEINTPAFQKEKGYTDYEEMMAFIRNLMQSHSDVMSLTFIGT